MNTDLVPKMATGGSGGSNVVLAGSAAAPTKEQLRELASRVVDAALLPTPDLATIQSILTSPHAKSIVDSRRKDGLTPLHAAMEGGSGECVEIVLAAGGDPSLLYDGWTVLHIGAAAGASAAFPVLFANSEPARKLAGSTGGEPNMRTPMHIAAIAGQSGVVKAILPHVTHVNHKDISGKTPLMLAAEENQATAAQLLVDCGKVEIDLQDANGATALILASRMGHEAMVKLLLRKGAKRDIANIDGKPAASMAKTPSLAKIILEYAQESTTTTTAKPTPTPTASAAASSSAQSTSSAPAPAPATPKPVRRNSKSNGSSSRTAASPSSARRNSRAGQIARPSPQKQQQSQVPASPNSTRRRSSVSSGSSSARSVNEMNRYIVKLEATQAQLTSDKQQLQQQVALCKVQLAETERKAATDVQQALAKADETREAGEAAEFVVAEQLAELEAKLGEQRQQLAQKQAELQSAKQFNAAMEQQMKDLHKRHMDEKMAMQQQITMLEAQQQASQSWANFRPPAPSQPPRKGSQTVISTCL